MFGMLAYRKKAGKSRWVLRIGMAKSKFRLCHDTSDLLDWPLTSAGEEFSGIRFNAAGKVTGPRCAKEGFALLQERFLGEEIKTKIAEEE
jgi:hypothetical protein